MLINNNNLDWQVMKKDIMNYVTWLKNQAVGLPYSQVINEINSKDSNDWALIEWGTLDMHRRFFEYLYEDIDKCEVQNIGSFITYFFNLLNDHHCDFQPLLEAKLQDMFTLSGVQISLPDIGYLYSQKDSDIVGYLAENNENLERTTFWHPQESLYVDEAIKKCFSGMISPKDDHLKPFDEEFQAQRHLVTSPCNDTKRHPNCEEYCSWHKDKIDTWSKIEFLTVMKQTLPPRKITPQKLTRTEEKIFKKLFNNSTSKTANQTIANSIAPIVFCYDRKNGFIGDGELNSCDNFFHMPCDSGMCLSTNMDVKKIMHITEEYGLMFESDLQKEAGRFDGETLWSQMSFFIFLDGSNRQGENQLKRTIRRDLDENLNEIDLKIHPSNEVAEFALNDNYESNLVPLTLNGGYEYFIDITSSITQVSDEYLSTDLKERQCFGLDDSLPSSSTFKIYTRANCKYDCLIKKAQELCQCIPWDFIDNKSTKTECDVFGRTCFFNSLKNESQSQTKVCPHCLDNCENVKYQITRFRKRPLDTLVVYENWKDQIVDNLDWIGSGEREFAKFLMDNNHTLIDKGFKKIFNSFTYRPDTQYEYLHYQRHLKFIKVHIRFLRPILKKIDLKYNSLDKIANFGGKFGIFAQLTGCSLLAIFKIIFKVFKTFFSQRSIKAS